MSMDLYVERCAARVPEGSDALLDIYTPFYTQKKENHVLARSALVITVTCLVVSQNHIAFSTLADCGVY